MTRFLFFVSHSGHVDPRSPRSSRRYRAALAGEGRTRRAWYEVAMGGVSDFLSFAIAVREHLWVLRVEPAFSYSDETDVASFTWPPFRADLESHVAGNARLLLSSHGELVRTVDVPMTETSARLVADGIIAVFEPEATSDSR